MHVNCTYECNRAWPCVRRSNHLVELLQEVQRSTCGDEVRLPVRLVEDYIDMAHSGAEFSEAQSSHTLAVRRGLQGKTSALQNLKRGIEALAREEGLATGSQSG